MTAIPDLSTLVNLMSGGGSGAPEHIWFFRDNRIAGAASNASTAGFMQSLWLVNGVPGRASAPGAAAVPDNTTAGGLLQTDPAGGKQKWMLGLEADSSQPGVLIVYDRLFHVSGLDGTSTNPQAVQGNATSQSLTSISNASPAVVTKAGHGYSVGQKLQFTTTGTLPSGLSLSTNYWVISAGYSSSAFEVAASLGGAAINTTTNGSGTHTAVGQGPVAPLTRYTNGKSVMAFWEVYTQLGVTGRTLTMSYTDQDANTGNTSQAVNFGGTTNTLRNVQSAGFMALADGDSGIRAIDSVTISASTGTAGDFGMTMGVILASIGIGNTGWGTARDMISGFPSMVECLTDASLGLLWMPTNTVAPQVTGAVHFVEY